MYADGTVPGDGRRSGGAVPAGPAPAIAVPATAAVPAASAPTTAAVPFSPTSGIVADSVRRELRARIVVIAFSLVASTSLALVLSVVLGTAG